MLISNFLITGNATVGERIMINYKGKTNLKFNYNWQISNGFDWDIISNLNFYDIKSNDIEKRLRCVVTYFDEDNYLESIITKILVIKDNLKLISIDSNDDKVFLTFNKSVIINNKLQLTLSNNMTASYLSRVKSNIIEFKINKFKKYKGSVSIKSINLDIKDEDNLSIKDNYKDIFLDNKPSFLRIYKNPASFNTINTNDFIFLSSKPGKIMYEGISDKNANLKYAQSKFKNHVLLSNLEDKEYNLSIRVIDIAGNKSNLLKINPFTIHTNDLSPIEVSIYSFNKNKNLAKIDDDIELNFKLNKYTEIVNIQIMQKYMKLNKLKDQSYSIKYKIGKKDKGIISFIIKYKLLNGEIRETKKTTNNSYVLIDNFEPKIKDIRFIANNTLKLDDEVLLNIEFNKDVIPNIKIFDTIPLIKKISNKSYQAKLIINELIDSNYENDYIVEFTSLNNIHGKTYSKKSNIYNFLLKKPKLQEIKPIGVSYETSPIYIFNSDEEGKVYYSDNLKSDFNFVRKGDNCIKFNNLSNGIYNESLTIENNLGNRSKLNISEFKIINKEDVINLIDLSIKSDNIHNDKIARIGNTVSIMFTTNIRAKNIDIDFEINSRKINFDTKIENIFNDCFWLVEFQINSNTPIGELLFKLKLVDENDFVLIQRSAIRKIKFNVVNINYENLKADFDLFSNKLNDLNSYLDVKFSYIENMINIVEHNVYPKKIFYLWQREDENKWVDIKSTDIPSYEITNEDIYKNIRVKIYYIDENKNLNLKYSNDFFISEERKMININ